MPLSPGAAQTIADCLNCSLPTRKMVDDIYAAAEVKLEPEPIPPSSAMTTLAVFSNHCEKVRVQLSKRKFTPGALVAGHKKDVVISPRLVDAPGKVAIYGWHQTNGTPIQPLYAGHSDSWVDYSQCIRLVSQNIILNGQPQGLTNVLADPVLCTLLSDEGPIAVPRYRTSKLAGPTEEGRKNRAEVQANGFETSRSFNEQTATILFDPEVRIQVNAPTELNNKQLTVVFYALPNGNSTEQTKGKALAPGDDWRYDIQHIAAQTRFLRDKIPGRGLVVAYLETAQKSWPAWRNKHGDAAIPGMVESVLKLFSGKIADLALSGHSGGGSWIFGYLNAFDRIPDAVKRISFLDSNYAYDQSAGHTGKLRRWLAGSSDHYLCILAYDDASALLDGKPFVSASGGTWGRSHAMQHDLAAFFDFTARTNAEFNIYTALDGRLQFLLRQNPERKIYHTVQVERNGFIHSMLVGTTLESSGYEYFGPRAYNKWITSEP